MLNDNEKSKSTERLESKAKATTTITISVPLLDELDKRKNRLNFKSRSRCIEHYILLGVKAENRISGGEQP